MEGLESSASLIKCKVTGNGKKPWETSGIKAFAGGRLDIHECLINGNTEGVHVFYLSWQNGGLAKEVLIEDSEIYDNKYEGVRVAGAQNSSCPVTIRRNKIYHNNGHGVEVSFHAKNVRLQENTIFENFWWGIWVQCNSSGYYDGNEICNNKMGGMRVGKQSPGKPACVVEKNFIHDNCGPAFHEALHVFEYFSFPDDLQEHFLRHEQRNQECLLGAKRTEFKIDVSCPNVVLAEFKSNNQCDRNSIPKANLQSTSSKTNCAFCFRREVKLKCCKSCMTARYCGKECQTLHWGRHKYICAAIAQRNAIEVSIPVCDGIQTRICTTHPSLDPTGPRYAPRPRKDGTRFVVKIQTFEGLFAGVCLDSRGYVSDEYNPEKASMTIYDRSRYVDFKTSKQPRLYHLVMECGVMGSSMYLAKKLFCWAAYKDGKTLRIFTHEFPPVQKW